MVVLDGSWKKSVEMRILVSQGAWASSSEYWIFSGAEKLISDVSKDGGGVCDGGNDGDGVCDGGNDGDGAINMFPLWARFLRNYKVSINFPFLTLYPLS